MQVLSLAPSKVTEKEYHIEVKNKKTQKKKKKFLI